MVMAAMWVGYVGAVDVKVLPEKKVRQAIPIEKGPWYEIVNLHTDSPWEIKDSCLETHSDLTLWSRESKTVYRMLNGYSSQEYALITGELHKRSEGSGNGTKRDDKDPTFEVSVPAVDIDWVDVPKDEVAEDTYIHYIPYVTEKSKWERSLSLLQEMTDSIRQ